MNNKEMIVLCVFALIALVGWLAALAGRETIEDLAKEIRFLRSENVRLESLLKASEARCLSYTNGASKEPSTVEALAALQAKCRRAVTCDDCGKDLPLFCGCPGGHWPETYAADLAEYPHEGAQELSAAIAAKVKEYMEVNS